MKRIENIAATLFGLLFLLLGFAVAAETLMRKILNKSLQGVDELGGYILAVGAALSFAVALAGRAHIRIDIIHDRLPLFLRSTLDLTALLAMTVSAVVVLAMGWISLSDSILFNATAQTPWATPLHYPQRLWVAALALFVLACAWEWLRLARVVRREGFLAIDRHAGPRSSREELAEELESLKARGIALPAAAGDKTP